MVQKFLVCVILILRKKEIKINFNPDEFNQSVQVLPTLVDVDRADWPSLFGEAQNYWKVFSF
jgi:hypothetical protein